MGGDSVGRCEKKVLNEHVSDSEPLQRYSCLNLQTSLLHFLSVGLDEERSFQNRVGTAGELLASILDAAGLAKNREDQMRRTARDLRTRVAK